MSNTLKLSVCPRCGAPIPAGAPEGLCPKCVLQAAATEDDAPMPAADTSEIPSLERVAAAFPKLEIIELIGRGGMGYVFKARQPHLGRFVALKLLPDKLARDPRFAERFNREGRVLARLNHSNIVSVYDFGATEHFYFLLMEFVDGVNLRQAMQAGRFSPAEALRVVPKICEALQYAHEQGILHRDIKPANILLDTHGHVKIADFGIAKLIGDKKPDVTLTATGAALGTPQYMAPEQLENPSSVDHRADIYSLGVVFYEMLTGELPIGRFAAPSSKTPVGPNVDEVVFRTLEKDRERRYQSAGEVKTQVEHLDKDQNAGIVGTPKNQGKTGLSRWAVFGAALTSLSFPVPILVVAAVLAGVGRIGPFELVLTVASFGLGLVGTILGWRGLHEIRESAGAMRGLALAVFASLAWPLAILIGPVVAVPMVLPVLVRDGSSVSLLSRAFFFLLAASGIILAFWSVRACVRWGTHQRALRRHSMLKWVFIGVIVTGIGIEMAFLADRVRIPRLSGAHLKASPVTAKNPEPIRANFRLAKGQVVTFQFLRRDNDIPTPVSEFVGYAVAPDDERARLSLVLAPAQPLSTQTNRPAWRFSLVAEEGATAFGSVQDFGDLISSLPTNYLHSIEPDTSFEMMLTRPFPGAETNGPAPRARLSLAVVSRSRGNIGGPQAATTVGAGSTNWAFVLQHQATVRGPRPRPGEVLAYQWLKSPVGTNTTNTIRFTFTNVELRQEGGHEWLAMDFATYVRGDCEEVFRLDGTNFVTRKTSLMVTPQDSPPVLHQRFEWQIPAATSRATVTELAHEFAKALVGKSFVIPEGEQRPLLRFPVGATGDVSIGIGARLRLSPSK